MIPSRLIFNLIDLVCVRIVGIINDAIIRAGGGGESDAEVGEEGEPADGRFEDEVNPRGAINLAATPILRYICWCSGPATGRRA